MNIQVQPYVATTQRHLPSNAWRSCCKVGFRALEWRNIGAPVTTMPDGRCGIPRCCGGPPITRVSLRSILR